MDWLRDHLWETWLIVAVLLGVAETLTLDLFLLMLAGGALAGVGTGLVTDNVILSVLVSAATAVLLLLGVRPPLVKRLHGGPELVLGHHNLIGTRGVITETVLDHRPGRVKLGGENWLAVSTGAETDIEVGRTVEVVEINGATAHVRPVVDPAIEAGPR